MSYTTPAIQIALKNGHQNVAHYLFDNLPDSEKIILAQKKLNEITDSYRAFNYAHNEGFIQVAEHFEAENQKLLKDVIAILQTMVKH